MRLRRPCKHGRYEEHQVFPPFAHSREFCPGGEFLPEDALVLRASDFDRAVLSAALGNKGEPLADKIVRAVARSVFDALADQVGEPG